jgi:hypothetical protein
MNLCQNTAFVHVCYMLDPITTSRFYKTWPTLNFFSQLLGIALWILPHTRCMMLKWSCCSSLIRLLACSYEFMLHFCALRQLDCICCWLPVSLYAQTIISICLQHDSKLDVADILVAILNYWLIIVVIRRFIVIRLQPLHLWKPCIHSWALLFALLAITRGFHFLLIFC